MEARDIVEHQLLKTTGWDFVIMRSILPPAFVALTVGCGHTPTLHQWRMGSLCLGVQPSCENPRGYGLLLWGFDPNEQKYVGASVRNTSGRVHMWVMWFTAQNTLEGFNYRSPLAPSASVTRRFVIEFRTTDEWVQTNSYPNGGPSAVERFVRVKGEKSLIRH